MSKVLRTAAVVVGVAAIAFATAGAGLAIAGAGGGLGLGAGALGSALAVGTVGVSISGLATIAAGLSLAAQLTAKKPSISSGTQIEWTSDPNAGVPYVMGRTMVGGNIIYRRAYGNDNTIQSIVTILSGGGPIQGYENLYVDDAVQAFDGLGEATGRLDGMYWRRFQLGATPSTALTSPQGAMPGWTASSKLSGYAADVIAMKFTPKGKRTLTREPKATRVILGVKVYDPRLDSTYPGGSGSCRALVESTYVYSENPWLHGLTWALGRWQNSKKAIGLGAPIEGVDVAAYVEAANVADLNSWKIGGAVRSRPDTTWAGLKAMCQAGGGWPIALGAKISCVVNAPRVSIGTITTADLAGPSSNQATQARRERINGVIPRYRSEAHNWQIIPASVIRVADYVTFDGEERTSEIEYPLVQQLKQAAELARYDIENAREFGPIDLTCKLRMYGYKPGDVVTATIPELGLNGQDILILDRTLDPATNTVKLTARSETAAKHPFALGQTTTAPPTPGVSGPPLVPVPGVSAWTISATSISGDGVTQPALVVTGAVDADGPSGVFFEYRPYTGLDGADDNWISAGGIDPATTTRKEITGLVGSTQYQVSIRYQFRGEFSETRRILGPVTTDAAEGIEGPAGPPGASGFTLVNHANMAIDGNKITKVSGSNSNWDSAAYSSEAWVGGAYVSWKPGTISPSGIMVGLNTDPTTGVSYTDIDYAWYAYPGSSDAYIYENGVSRGVFGSYSPGTVFATHYDGANVRYYMDGDLKRTVAASAGLKFYLDCAFYGLGAAATITGFGPAGAVGADGLSIAELTVYRRSTSAPATPTGGSYNFATKVLTSPAGWSATIPAGNDPLYEATGTAAVQGTTGTATPTWAGVGLRSQDGTGTNMVFRRSATAPATPAASAGVPVGWYDSTGSVPAGADPIWTSFGTRPNAGANWTWQSAKRVEGEDGISPASIAISPNTATVQLNKDGTVKSGQLPLNFVVTAMQGGSAIPLTSLTINASVGGTFSEDDAKITLSALSDDNAEVQFTAVAGGQSVVGVIAVSTAQDGAGGASTSLSTTSTLTIANQTSYTQVGEVIAINVSSAGKLKVNFSGMIRPNTIEGYQWQSKIQYSLNGGSTWVDVVGSAKDSSATFELDVPPFGMRGGTLSSANPLTVTGLTADAPALVRGLVQRKSGAATASGTMSGTLTLYAEQVL